MLSGGGARGAYEAGVIHYIRTMLPPEVRKRRFDILCGSSVGAINTCVLASTAHDLPYQGKRAFEIWRELKQENLYKRDIISFARLMGRSFRGIVKNLFGGLDAVPRARKHFGGFLNTSPMGPFLRNQIAWNQISLNIRNRLLLAVSVTATNVHSGKIELFVEKHPEAPYTGHYIFHEVKLGPAHVMASAAIPLIFSTVNIDRNDYMDGGLRLNTPMSPAIQLGADRILVVGLHHREERAESVRAGEFIRTNPPPTLGTLIGKILSSLFMDKLDYDIEQMTRINRIVEWGEETFGRDFVARINTHLREHNIQGDIANRGLKKLSALSIYPSRDVRDIFLECIESTKAFEKGLTRFERILLKVLDTDIATGKDFLSFIMFYPPYMARLLELGFEDARQSHDQLTAFLSG